MPGRHLALNPGGALARLLDFGTYQQLSQCQLFHTATGLVPAVDVKGQDLPPAAIVLEHLGQNRCAVLECFRTPCYRSAQPPLTLVWIRKTIGKALGVSGAGLITAGATGSQHREPGPTRLTCPSLRQAQRKGVLSSGESLELRGTSRNSGQVLAGPQSHLDLGGV